MDALQHQGPKSGHEKIPASEATWDELPDAEKISRLRLQLQLLGEAMRSQQQVIERLLAHVHAPDGAMLVPMSAGGMIAGQVPMHRVANTRDPLR